MRLDAKLPTNPLSWQIVLENTGYLSFDQLFRIFHLKPEAIELPGDIIVFKDALWQSSRFHRGSHHRHRALVTESYIHLYPGIQSWQLAGMLYGLCPDAIIRIPSSRFPILLEIDTGKETMRQWRTKLTAYRLEGWTNPQFALWVIALGGKVRLSRLGNWIAQQKLPIDWHLSHATQIETDIGLWESQRLNNHPPLAPLSHPREQRLPLCYREMGKNQSLSLEEASERLKAGWIIVAKEITNQGLLYYLKSP